MKLIRRLNPSAMPRLLIALVASMAALGAGAVNEGQARLLVNIMVDGLDADYLDLLREQFGNDGFRRLQQQGVSFTADYGTSIDCAAATATVFSGAAPSTSGIGGSMTFDRRTLKQKPVYADASVLGNFTNQPYSPAALRVTNISDESRIASGGTNSVYSIAADAATSIGMAGHAATSALWLDSRTGNWASSTAYPEMPVIVATRNRTTPLSMRLDTMSWTPTLDPASYPALPDHLTRYPFRYVFPRANAARLDMFAASPLFAREATALASELIVKQKLGRTPGVTDIVNIAVSLNPIEWGKSADKRVETMDAYIKLDRCLAQLFADIDRSAGMNNTAVLLASTPPRQQRRRDDERWNLPYGEFSARKAASLLNLYLIALHGNGAYVSHFNDGHIYLNHKLIEELKLDLATVRREAAQLLSGMTGVDRVFTLDDILAGRAGEKAEALRRNTVAANAGDLLVKVAPGFEIIDDFDNEIPAESRTAMVQTSGMATSPFYILAPNIEPQTLSAPVDVRSVAPTIAGILRIRSPNAAGAASLQLKK